MHGALDSYCFPLPSLPCVPFPILLRSPPHPWSPSCPYLLPFSVTSTENHCRNGFREAESRRKNQGTVSKMGLLCSCECGNYTEGLEYIYAHRRGNLIITHPWQFWSQVISFHILTIVLACSLCMGQEMENDLPLKSRMYLHESMPNALTSGEVKPWVSKHGQPRHWNLGGCPASFDLHHGL